MTIKQVYRVLYKLCFLFLFYRCIAKVTGEHQDDWDEFLDPILFSIRTSIQESTKHTPFFLMHGREARFPLEVEKSTEVNGYEDGKFGDVQKTLRRLQALKEKIFPEVSKNIDTSQDKQKKQYKKRREIDQGTVIKEGDLVLRLNMLKRTRKGSKSEDTWTGPYRVHDVSKYGFCQLQSMANAKYIRSKVNVRHLKHYQDPQSSAAILASGELSLPGRHKVCISNATLHSRGCLYLVTSIVLDCKDPQLFFIGPHIVSFSQEHTIHNKLLAICI